MSTIVKLPINGAIIYWSMDDSPKQRITEAFYMEGYVSPKDMSDTTALKRAMDECCNEKNFRVESRKKPKQNGVEILAINRGEDSNSYISRYGARVVVDTETERRTIVLDIGSYDLQYNLQAEFDKQKATLTGGSIGEAMVNVCKKLDGSTELRPGGCIYWLPQYSLERWNRLVGRLGQINPKNRVHQWATAQDENTLHEVRDALMREVQEASTRILSDLHEKQLRDEGLQSRRDEATALIEKTERYAELLGEKLDYIKAIAEMAKNCAIRDTMVMNGM